MPQMLNDNTSPSLFSGGDSVMSLLNERPNYFGTAPHNLNDPKFARQPQFGLDDGRIVVDDTMQVSYADYFIAKAEAESRGNKIIYNPFTGRYNEIADNAYRNAALSTINFYGNGNMYEISPNNPMYIPNSDINHYSYKEDDNTLVVVNRVTGDKTIYHLFKGEWLSEEQCSNLFIRTGLKKYQNTRDLNSEFPVFMSDYKPQQNNQSDVIKQYTDNKTIVQMDLFDYMHKFSLTPQGKKLHDEFINKQLYTGIYNSSEIQDEEVLEWLAFVDKKRTFEELDRDLGAIIEAWRNIKDVTEKGRFNPPKIGTIDYYLKQEEKRVGKTDDIVDSFYNRSWKNKKTEHDEDYKNGIFMNEIDYELGQASFDSIVAGMLMAGTTRKGKAPTERGKATAMRLRKSITDTISKLDNGSNNYNVFAYNPLSYINVETAKGRIYGNLSYDNQQSNYLKDKYNFKMIIKRGGKIIKSEKDTATDNMSDAMKRFYEQQEKRNKMTKSERQSDMQRYVEEQEKIKKKREELKKETPKSVLMAINDKLIEYKTTSFMNNMTRKFHSWFTDIYYYIDGEVDGFYKSIYPKIENFGRDGHGIIHLINKEINNLWFDNIMSYFRNNTEDLITCENHHRKSTFDSFKEVYDLMTAARLPKRRPCNNEEVDKIMGILRRDPENVPYKIEFTDEQKQRLEEF